MGGIKNRIKKFIGSSVAVPNYTTLLLNTPIAQKQLMLQYRSLKNTPQLLPELKDTGFQAYSQTDEDGLLLYIFS